MKQFILLFAAMAFTIGHAQTKKQRESFNLRIKADANEIYAVEVPQSAYFVKEKVLQVYTSETLFIETEIKGDSILSMKVVEKNKHPEKTIVVAFTQEANGQEVVSKLKVSNPFGKKLHYNAAMSTPKNKDWKSTNTAAVSPTAQAYESWPYGIIMLQLDKWRLE